MSPSKKFSIRHGIEAELAPIIEEAPEEVRYFLVKFIEEHCSFFGGGQILQDFFRAPGFSFKFANPHDPSASKRFYGYIAELKWFEFYNLLEVVYERLPNDYIRSKFVSELNRVFSDRKVGYLMTAQVEISYKGSEPFETATKTTESVLTASGRNTAKDEIHKALEDLSKRPVPDLTGAVHHAMAALECVANEVCGEKGETLGQVIKKHPEKFPPPLGEAVSKLYGFASAKGTHRGRCRAGIQGSRIGRGDRGYRCDLSKPLTRRRT